MSKTDWAGVVWALIIGGAGAHAARHGAGLAIGVIALAPLAVSLAASRRERRPGVVSAVDAQALAWAMADPGKPAQPGQPVRPAASPRAAARLSWTFS